MTTSKTTDSHTGIVNVRHHLPKHTASNQYENTPTLFAPTPEYEQAFWEFFKATIRNAHTQAAYLTACHRFSRWCLDDGINLYSVTPSVVAEYIDDLAVTLSVASVKQHLAALRKLFRYLVIRHLIETDPTAPVTPPRISQSAVGKTPILNPLEMKQLFDSIPLKHIVDFRDLAIIATMAYSFARVSAVVQLRVADYYTQSKRSYFQLNEKGTKYNEIPVHHSAQLFIDNYLIAAKIDVMDKSQQSLALFRALPPTEKDKPKADYLSGNAMTRHLIYQMVKRRCAAAGLPNRITNHSFRGTGITTFIANGGTLEMAAKIAGHASTTTTKLYDRTTDTPTLDDIERIIY